MAVIIDGLGQPVNITVAASGVVVCPVASILTGGGGGGSGVTDHGALTGLADDDHTQYHTDARGDARYSQLAHNHDHGNLTGLSDDDHPQYHNDARGDVRYAAINHSHAASAITVTASGFNGNLSPTDTNVQSALQKLDDLTVSVSGNLTGIDSISTPDWIQFDTAPAGTDAVGRLRWSTSTNTLNLGINSNITLPVGQQLIQEVMNNDGTAIAKGDVVYVLGASGNRLSVAKAKANAEATCSKTFGVALEAISNNQTGYVLTYGLVKGLNTNALQEGYAVWLSASVAGGLTTTRPIAPNHGVLIGFCVRQQSVNGELFVAITNGHELDELHNVNASSPASGDVLGFDSASQTWIPTQRVSMTDSRLSDARTPTAHKASHATGGTDALAPSDIGAVPTSRTVNGQALSSDVTITTTTLGAVPTTRTVNGSALSADITITAAPSGSAGGDLAGTYPNPTIASGAITSAKIADGTIVDGDISASAAISSTKISGLKTVATDTIFDAVGDLAVGTGADASARLAKGANGQVLAVGPSTLGYITAPPQIGGYAQPTASDHSTFGITTTVPIWATLGNQGGPTSGRIVLVPIELDVNLTISAIAFTSGTTAGVSLTNQWFVLCNSSKLALAYTTNDTTTAWGTNTRKQLSLTSAYTTTYRGRHYLGILVTASTVPSIRGLATTGTGIQSYALAADTGLTTPGTAGVTTYTAASTSAGVYYGEVV